MCCVEELDIVFRELYFGVSDVKSGRIQDHGKGKCWRWGARWGWMMAFLVGI